MNLSLTTLVLEVTRKCNMTCEHCLRGDAQCKDMSENVAAHIFDSLDSIGTITFSGGEPTLNIPIIEYSKNKLKNIEFQNFFMALNGSYCPNGFLDTIFELYSMANEQDYCSIAVSEDDFHDTDRYGLAYQKLSNLSFSSDSKKTSGSNHLISRGKAAEYGLGSFRKTSQLEFESFNQSGDSLYYEEIIYVNVNGDVFSDCDLSYEQQDVDRDGYIGNVLEAGSLNQLLINKYYELAAENKTPISA